MKKKFRQIMIIGTAFLLVVIFGFLPNIQAFITDKKTFGKSEKINLNPVEISVESTQTTLEKLKIVNDHVLNVSVAPSARTVDGNDLEKTTQKEVNKLFKKMKISYRVDEKWNLTYKKLYTFITKQGNQVSADAQGKENIENIKNLLVWYVVLTPDPEHNEELIALIMDAYTDQILAIDLFDLHNEKNWKELAQHINDIPKGFLSYLHLKQSEAGFKKNLLENTKLMEEYQDGKKNKDYSKISVSSGIYAMQNKKQVYLPIEWRGYGFTINNIYN